jgi:hypothetical protein
VKEVLTKLTRSVDSVGFGVVKGVFLISKCGKGVDVYVMVFLKCWSGVVIVWVLL